ncbi:MAG: exodeoxyribonuclease VII large subunit [Chloroflexia bacterium]
MSECPSCGRFTGPYETCPYCGARLHGRTPIRLLKVVALVLALAGLGGLWLAATHTEVARMQIGQVGGMMNMAYVRVEGRVVRGPDYDPTSEGLAFYVNDDTGELRVAAYRDAARELIATGKIPAIGDAVSVAGNLRVREDFVALYVNAAGQLTIHRPTPEDAHIGDLTPLDIGRRVRVRGLVREVREPYTGLTLITLRDATGKVDVAISAALEELTGPRPALSPGQGLEVVAAVTLYKSTVQLVPASTADLIPVAGLDVSPPLREIASLTSADVGRWVQVQGEVVESDPFSGGINFTLDDGTGRVTLLLWDSLYKQIPYSRTLDVGARVRVQGSVSLYRGALEVIPEVPADLSILVAAPGPEEVTVGALSPADAGRVVVLRGVLGPAEPFSKGVKYPLDDGTGTITLLLWENVVQEAPAGLGPGAEVRASGQVQEYRGTLEIVPRRGSDLEVLGFRPLPVPALTPIGSITPDDRGRTLTVEGALGEGEAFSKGRRFPLRDESGEIVLLLWQNVLDAFPQAGKLVAGVRVRITGRIDVYQDALEIIPEAGGIVILE